LLENLEVLLAASADSEVLQRQCGILREIHAEVRQKIKKTP